MSRRFDKSLETATDQTLVEPHWEGILDCVDLIRGLDVPVKAAVASIQKRIHNENPHVAHHALLVLEACAKNCGKKFLTEIATKDFMDDLRNILLEGTSELVKGKLLELIQCWGTAFQKMPEYRAICETHSFLKMYGFEFPKLTEADAMFIADSAPEWADGDNCFRCREAFSMFKRKHHCRNCGQIFCDRCSGRQMLLPNFGIEKKVRVCESCFLKKEGTVSKQPQLQQIVDEEKIIAESKAAEEARQRALKEQEEEELQLALAISQSEAEAKQDKQKGLFNHFSHQQAQPTESSTSIYQGVQQQQSDRDETEDPALAKYLNKSYWEQRQAQREANFASAPPQSELSFSMGSSVTNGHMNGQIPSTAATPTQDQGLNYVTQQFSQVSIKPLETDEVDQTALFCQELKEQVEVMNNRMLSNMKRGRSIVNDSAIHSLFKALTEKHADVLGRISKLENEREYYEGLQDQVAHIQEARQAVNSLRDEHERQRQERLAEEQRQRQQQMQTKLEMMRHKKHEMLMEQRHQALQRFQEQEAQIQQRRLQTQQPQFYAQPQYQQQHPGYPPQQHQQPPAAQYEVPNHPAQYEVQNQPAPPQYSQYGYPPQQPYPVSSHVDINVAPGYYPGQVPQQQYFYTHQGAPGYPPNYYPPQYPHPSVAGQPPPPQQAPPNHQGPPAYQAPLPHQAPLPGQAPPTHQAPPTQPVDEAPLISFD